MIRNKSQAVEAARFLRDHFEHDPEIALLTGTGLGDSTESLEIQTAIHYRDIPHFPISTVESHAGKLIFGRLKNRHVVSFQGRCHLYEGYSPSAVTFPVRVMRELGVNLLILSNAAGGLNPGFTAGDIMIIEDHINLTGSNPLAGPNEDSWGPRFPDMTRAYDARLQSLAKTAGDNAGIHLQHGVYAGLHGPSLETPAETRFSAVFSSATTRMQSAGHAAAQREQPTHFSSPFSCLCRRCRPRKRG